MITEKDAADILNLTRSIRTLRGEVAMLESHSLKGFNGTITLAKGNDWNARTETIQISDADLGREVVARLIKAKSSKVDEMCRRLRQLNAVVPE